LYGAQLNAENPLGPMQSIEYALRALDKSVMEEKEREARCEKMLADYQEQLGKPFEYESKLKDLLAWQAELNASLDLDKGERQVVPPAEVNSELGSDDGMGQEGRAVNRAAPRRFRRQREYEPEDADVDDGATIGQKPGSMMGQGP
jgi:hypothetical protein